MNRNSKYKEFQRKPMSPDEEITDVRLTFNGWKLLLDETLSPLIEKELGMRYLGDYIWATDYENDMRRVLKVFIINEAFACFNWGLNFRFVPKRIGNKSVYARTDKSIHLHTICTPYYFSYRTNDYTQEHIEKRNRIIFSSWGGSIESFEKSIEQMKLAHIKVFQNTLPEIKEYFSKTSTYEKILDLIISNCNHKYIFSESELAAVFIQRYLGMVNEAEEHFQRLNFENDEIKNETYKKFIKVIPNN